MRKIIRADNVSKKFKTVFAVNNVSFETNLGEIFGIIGADGAGKTTLIRMITTLSLPDSGHIFIKNMGSVKDFKQIRKILGYMPGVFSLYSDLSIEENLDFFASVYGTTVKDNYELIKDIYIQIEPFKKRKARQLSGGMKQKLALCCALIHRPQVLVLDEPTTGVDPVSRREFWGILKRLKSEGITIVVSTPYMDEAALCDRIAFMHGGSFLTDSSPESIISSFHKTLFAVYGEISAAKLAEMRGLAEVESCFTFGDSYHVVVKDGVTEHTLAAAMQSQMLEGYKIEGIQPNLEDCFMEFLK